jgi:hypothetical protein
MAQTPEGRVKDAIKKELKSRGFAPAGGSSDLAFPTGWYYMPVSNGMGSHGIPDFVGCWEGDFFSIEAKAPGGEPTPMQLRRHEEIRKAGGIILVIDNVEDLRKWFDARRPN